MTTKTDRANYPIPEAAARLLDYLHIEDRRTNGKPRLRDEDEVYAREWLMEILIDTLSLWGHTDELKRLYGGQFRQGRPHWERPEGQRFNGSVDELFSHRELLPEDKAEAVVERGIGADTLPMDELACLLLNPVALWDLSDMIDHRTSEWWDGPMGAHAAKLMAESGFELPMPKPKGAAPTASLSPWSGGVPLTRGGLASGPESWRLTFEEPSLMRRIAEHLYGETDCEFELNLHRQVADTGLCTFELEVLPAPTHQALTFTLRLNGGEERSLTLEVPAKRGARARSGPCAAVAWQTPTRADWRDEMPPVLEIGE